MGQIQQSVNSMIGSMGLMAGLIAHSPAVKDAKEIRSLNKEIGRHNAVEASAKQDYSDKMNSLRNEVMETGMSKEQESSRSKALAKAYNEITGVTAQKRSDAYGKLYDLTGNKDYLQQSVNDSQLAKIRAIDHMQNAIEERYTAKQLYDQLKPDEKRDFRKTIQHEASQEKRGGK